jgi:hypothetical protein
MTKPIIRIHDSLTDTVVDREMTELEIAELELTRNPPPKDEA